MTVFFALAFGWSYPHFLQADHWTAYLYAAPLGIVPCPTLSALVGCTLVFGLFRSTMWALALAATGLFYGAIGVFRLRVELDYVLLVGATLLAVLAVREVAGRYSVRASSTERGSGVCPFKTSAVRSPRWHDRVRYGRVWFGRGKVTGRS